MPEREATASPAPRQLNDVVAAALLLLAIMLGCVIVTGGLTLFTRPLWLDEYHTFFLADKQSLTQSLRSLAQGADFNPPTLHLIYRALGAVTGALSPVKLRIVSFASVWLALTFVYATLRRFFSPTVAFTGPVAIWTHPLAIAHAFEARFYGPWLLFSAALAWSVGVDPERAISRRRDIVLAMFAILTCTIHYFGVFAWVVVFGAAIIAGQRSGSKPREIRRRVAPMLLGPVAVALCMPLYIGQRQALTVKTWVDPLNVAQLRDFLMSFFFWIGFVIPVVTWGALRLIRGAKTAMPNAVRDVGRTARQSPTTSDQRRATHADLLALLGMAVVPVILIIFSATVQPSLIRRFAIPTLLFWGPMVALSMDRVPRLARIIVLEVLIVVAGLGTRAYVMAARQTTNDLAADVAALDALGGDETVAFRTRHRLYPIAYPLGGKRHVPRPTLGFIDFDDSTARQVGGPVSGPTSVRFLTLERDVARVHTRLYGFPLMLPVDRLRGNDRFYMLDEDDSDAFSRSWFPGFSVRRVAPRLFLLTRVRIANQVYNPTEAHPLHVPHGR
jgi:hypothetical protein